FALGLGYTADCTINNHAIPSSPTRRTTDRNDNGGTAAATAWTLSASGPTPISGAGGVGPSNAKAGTYTLSESGSVPGYTNGTSYSWVSTPAGGAAGAPVPSNSIALALGDSA